MTLNAPARERLAVIQRDKELATQQAAEREQKRRDRLSRSLTEKMIAALGPVGVGTQRWALIQADVGIHVEVDVAPPPTFDIARCALRLRDDLSGREISITFPEGRHVSFGSDVLPVPANAPPPLWDSLLAWVADVRSLEPLASEEISMGIDTEGVARQAADRVRDRFDADAMPPEADSSAPEAISPGAEDSSLTIRSVLPLDGGDRASA